MLRFPRTTGTRLEELVSHLSLVHFMRRVVNIDVWYGQPNGQTGDEWARAIGTQTPSMMV
jgi:hypothetical protein